MFYYPKSPKPKFYVQFLTMSTLVVQGLTIFKRTEKSMSYLFGLCFFFHQTTPPDYRKQKTMQ
jgi:hypothetical protein